jgi:hypothetical protein
MWNRWFLQEIGIFLDHRYKLITTFASYSYLNSSHPILFLFQLTNTGHQHLYSDSICTQRQCSIMRTTNKLSLEHRWAIHQQVTHFGGDETWASVRAYRVHKLVAFTPSFGLFLNLVTKRLVMGSVNLTLLKLSRHWNLFFEKNEVKLSMPRLHQATAYYRDQVEDVTRKNIMGDMRTSGPWT